MHTFLDDLKIESFKKSIDISDFLIDHRERLTGRFFTRYFKFSFFGNHEINIIQDSISNKFAVNIIDQICSDHIEREKSEKKRFYQLHNFFKRDSEGGFEFDWQKVFEANKREMQEFFFEPYNSSVSERSLKNAIKYTGVILRNYYYKREDELREKSKDIHERILKYRASKLLKK